MDNYITNCIHHQVCRGAYNCQTRCQYFEERSQGEWIFRNGVTCGGYYKCSKCGEVERAEKNFCPNCGASMKKGGTE